jgi:allantoicase
MTATLLSHSPSITGVNDLDNFVDVSGVKEENQVSSFEQQGYVNAASSKSGARILFATDEWFATADNLLKDGPPVFDPDEYCEQGKVMDGWETRRRREEGHDWSIVRLAQRTKIYGIEVDTAFFTGNHVPAISLQVADLTHTDEVAMVTRFPGALERLLHGCVQGTGASPAEVQQAEEACSGVSGVTWAEILPKTNLLPGYDETRLHYFTLSVPVEASHVRINYYPDGGIARMRFWGIPLETPKPRGRPAYVPIKTGTRCTVVSHKEAIIPSRQPFEYPELSSEVNGGMGLTCSNKHYGDPWNLIQYSLGKDMGDGWETARHPNRPSILVKDPNTSLVDSPLSDWCIIKLGSIAEGGVKRIILDTKHFRGNYPESVKVEGCFAETTEFQECEIEWFPLVPRCRMAPDSEHVFDSHQIVNNERFVSHIRVSIYPDGGLSRVRVYGQPGDRQ